ncbi:MAG: UvrB/UvrC motif-containing protein, partial [Planctomycetes bacterium]|nr:UvrB/UvrC motif-containing protein [Planctomycetota bacterium]
RRTFIYPAQHYVMPEDRIESALAGIGAELEKQLEFFRGQGKLLEAQRLGARTRYDMEMIREVGFCSGIENYAHHLGGLMPGDRPYTLIDYFPDDYLLIIDESHVSIPQIRAMHAGDYSRKRVLVDHGFRLPSALDNRPLRFEEFEELWNRVLFVSATPGPYELTTCAGEVVEQIIRPTGLVDPIIHVKPATSQVSDLIKEIEKRVQVKERVLVTTLTKRLAEDLSRFITDKGYRCTYLHSEINTLERVGILRNLRAGEVDILIGVNLLREGLDLPEVSLVAILDADKEGFLRSETALVQTIGRTARNVNAKVILYADKITNSMARAIQETDRRRKTQQDYNKKHNITPETIRKAIRVGLEREFQASRKAKEALALSEQEYDKEELIAILEKEMVQVADKLEFEKAARIRDEIAELREAPILGKGKRQKGKSKTKNKRFKQKMLRTRIKD